MRWAARALVPRPPAGVGACLGSPSGSLRYLCALGSDGSLTLLSPPRLLPGAAGEPPALEPPGAEQRIGTPADAFGCSSDGGLLAVAGGQHVSLYLIGGAGSGSGSRGGAARAPPRASLLWRAPLHCLGRSVAVARLGGAGVGSRSLVAVGCSMGLLVLTEADAAAGGPTYPDCRFTGFSAGPPAPETAGARRSAPRSSPANASLLLPGLLVCAVALDPSDTHLAAAAVDGSIFLLRLLGRAADQVGYAHRRAAALLRPLWVVHAVGLERPCSLAFSSCLASPGAHGVGASVWRASREPSRLLVGGWLGHVAVIDCGTRAAHPDQACHPDSACHPGAQGRHGGGGARAALHVEEPPTDRVSPASFGRASWRLLAVLDPPPTRAATPPEPAPALLAACRAPHAAGVVIASPGGMAAPLHPAAPSHSSAAGHLGTGLAAPPPAVPRRALRAVCAGYGTPPLLADGVRRAVSAEVRGLCAGRLQEGGTHASLGGEARVDSEGQGAVRAGGESLGPQAGEDEAAVEVVCWLDSEGALDCAMLWRWSAPALAAAAATPLLLRAYDAAELIAVGALRLGATTDGQPGRWAQDWHAREVGRPVNASAPVWLWVGGRSLELPRDAGAAIRQWLVACAGGAGAGRAMLLVVVGASHVAVLTDGLVQMAGIGGGVVCGHVSGTCGEGGGGQGDGGGEDGDVGGSNGATASLRTAGAAVGPATARPDPPPPPGWASLLLPFVPCAACFVGSRLLLLTHTGIRSLPAPHAAIDTQAHPPATASVRTLRLPLPPAPHATAPPPQPSQPAQLTSPQPPSIIPDSADASRFVLRLPRWEAGGASYALLRGEVDYAGEMRWLSHGDGGDGATGGGGGGGSERSDAWVGGVLRAPWAAGTGAPQLVGAAGGTLLFERLGSPAAGRWLSCDTVTGAFCVVAGPPAHAADGAEAVRLACAHQPQRERA
jgi:hypothetical protein